MSGKNLTVKRAEANRKGRREKTIYKTVTTALFYWENSLALRR
jgi:hypothetical protein